MPLSKTEPISLFKAALNMIGRRLPMTASFEMKDADRGSAPISSPLLISTPLIDQNSI
jgi:hypothetical protein